MWTNYTIHLRTLAPIIPSPAWFPNLQHYSFKCKFAQWASIFLSKPGLFCKEVSRFGKKALFRLYKAVSVAAKPFVWAISKFFIILSIIQHHWFLFYFIWSFGFRWAFFPPPFFSAAAVNKPGSFTYQIEVIGNIFHTSKQSRKARLNSCWVESQSYAKGNIWRGNISGNLLLPNGWQKIMCDFVDYFFFLESIQLGIQFPLFPSICSRKMWKRQ